MIVVQNGVWRSEFIAAIDTEGSEIQIYPTNSSKCVIYEYDSEQEASTAFIDIVTRWKKELEKVK